MSSFVGRVVPLSEVSRAFLKFVVTCGQLSTVAPLLNASSTKEGLQLHGEGCDGRLIQVS